MKKMIVILVSLFAGVSAFAEEVSVSGRFDCLTEFRIGGEISCSAVCPVGFDSARVEPFYWVCPGSSGDEGKSFSACEREAPAPICHGAWGDSDSGQETPGASSSSDAHSEE